MIDTSPACRLASAARKSGRIRLEGNRKQALEKSRGRLLVTGAVIAAAFLAIAGRLVDLTLYDLGAEPRLAHSAPAQPAAGARADIVDRNGVILATSLPIASLYADPREVIDAGEAADKLAGVLAGLDRDKVLAKLKSPGSFVWLRRNLTPNQHYEVNRLGIPGLFFQRGERRVYPHGRTVSHVLGLTDVDGRGIAGVERYFDQTLRRGGAGMALALDLRIQDMLRRELSSAVDEFDAAGAAGLILDVATGEVLAMVSLPDFDPNVPAGARGKPGFNRVTKGVYEMGSTFKLFTTAMALDSGTVTLRDGYDASRPINISRFTISDFHGKNRWLTVPEILVYSSNIGAAKMAMDVGGPTQRRYLERLGLLNSPAIELPEVGTPLTPETWRDINTMTISYGHGIAVSPLQMAGAVASVVNGGIRYPATLLKGNGGAAAVGERVLSAETSKQMRGLMRLVVRSGTGKKANARGYLVGGKTGTAEKMSANGYQSDSLISSFVGAFPIDRPRYVVMVLLDEPKGNEKTFNYATGGWVAAPVVRRMVRAMAPLLGIPPAGEDGKPGSGPARLASLRPGPAKPGEFTPRITDNDP
mgnify:CR=1 FL=1